MVVTAACSDDGSSTAEITSAELGDHAVSAVSAELTVETEDATLVSVTVDGPGGVFEIPAGEAATTHTVPVVGMRAESDYTITVHAEPEDGGDADEMTLDWTTGALPDDLPPVSVASADPDRMAPGVTVFNAFAWDPVPEGTPPGDAGFILAVDEEGHVVWYHRLLHQVLDVDTTPRGTFLVTAGESLIQEIDLHGSIVREWGTRVATEYAVKDLQGRPLSGEDTMPIDIDSAHHEVTELSTGNVMTLSTEVIELDPEDAARICPDNPEATIVGDIVVELSPEGDVVQEWPLSAVYDPALAPGTEMCIQGMPVAPPNWFYPGRGLTRDWTHANAIEVIEERNTLLVSLRHLDAIVALRYHDSKEGRAGQLLWSLGAAGSVALEGEPPRHQHAMEVADDGTLLLYDNGNMRPGTALVGGSEPPYSRAVRYQIDGDAGTARQVWEHRDRWADGRPVYTPFLGDVDLEPNGNVLITHGGGSSAAGGFLAKVVEVVPGSAPDGSADEIVFDLLVGDGSAPPAGGPAGWSVYRAERLPSLYFARA